VMVCYFIFIALMAAIGAQLDFAWPYWLGLAITIFIVHYHFTLIRRRDRAQCFKAFLHNNWLGAAVFIGTAVQFI
jgi:4-hydroxybenzoate polyprenyltransferase